MLRLHLYCSLLPTPTRIKHENTFATIIHPRREILHGKIKLTVRALKDEMNGGKPGQSWEPGLEIEVPFEQRPVNEYSSLKDESLYSWADRGPGSFFLRLGGLWLITFTVLGAPIAAASFNPSKDPLRFVLAAFTGTLFLVSLIVLRIYLVKPVIKLLKQTLIGTGALLVGAVSLFTFATPVENFIQKTFIQKENPSIVAASKTSSKFNIRKEELLRLPVDVMTDDDLAAAAAEAADGRPVYIFQSGSCFNFQVETRYKDS